MDTASPSAIVPLLVSFNAGCNGRHWQSQVLCLIMQMLRLWISRIGSGQVDPLMGVGAAPSVAVVFPVSHALTTQ